MSKTLFDHLNQIYNTQRVEYFDELEDVDRKTFSVYMVNRFISMNPDYLPVVNAIQQYWGQIGPREVYLFFSQILPKKKQFNKYIKGSKDSSSFDDWVVDIVKRKFSVSAMEAEDMLQIMYCSHEGKEYLRNLLAGFGIEEKKIKKAGLK